MRIRAPAAHPSPDPGYGLTDSPGGQCAWILEKFKAWTDWTTATRYEPSGRTTARQHHPLLADRDGDVVGPLVLEGQPAPFSRRVEVPTGASIFPKEIGTPVRYWAELAYPDLRYWNELDPRWPFRRVRTTRAVRPGAPELLSGSCADQQPLGFNAGTTLARRPARPSLFSR